MSRGAVPGAHRSTTSSGQAKWSLGKPPVGEAVVEVSQLRRQMIDLAEVKLAAAQLVAHCIGVLKIARGAFGDCCHRLAPVDFGQSEGGAQIEFGKAQFHVSEHVLPLSGVRFAQKASFGVLE